MKRLLVAAVALLALLDALGAYQVGVRDRQPPSFRRGGSFVTSSPPTATVEATAKGTAKATATTTTAPPPTAATVDAAPDPATGATSSTDPPGVTPTTGAPVPDDPTPTTVATATAKGLAAPTLGTYIWDVTGTESATAFGSRSFPPTMTMVAHTGAGLAANEYELDLTYSADHQEREIIGIEPNGLAFDFEAGQVRFGSTAQTNQAEYSPPMLQIPWPLRTGEVVTGSSKGLAGNGSVERVEDYRITVIGRQVLTVEGKPVNTWEVQVNRQSEPGASQATTRSTIFWFDPGRDLWVKFVEQEDGSQSVAGFAFTYHEQLTALLASSPS